jgi:PAS domain S-box-containing protein
MKRSFLFFSQPIKVVFIYIVLSGLWILFTDQIVEQLFTSPEMLTFAQTLKGWAFVAVSGLILYWVIRKSSREIEMNRDRYKAMLDNAKVGIARMVDMKIVSHNPAFQRILNENSQNTSQSEFIERLEDFDRAQFIKSIRALSPKGSEQHEFQLKLSENKRKWVQVTVSRHQEEEEYYQVILQDINDRKTYQSYTDLLLKVMLTLEPSDNFNDALKGILNNLCTELNWEYGIAYTPDEEGLFSKRVSWYRLDPLLDELDFIFDKHKFKSGEGALGKSVEERRAVWAVHNENGNDNKYRKNIIDADLSSSMTVPVVVSNEVIAVLELYNREVVARDNDLLRLLTAIGHDIGVKLEKRKQQDEKQKLEESLNFALRSADMATWDVELKSGRILRSKNHFELFGLNRSPNEWNIQKLIETVIPEDRQKVETALNEAVLETKGINVEYRIVKGQGIRWLWSRGDLQFDTFGEPVRLSGVVTDITQRKRFQVYTELLLEIILSIDPLRDLHNTFDQILKTICSKELWQYAEIWQINNETGKVKCTNRWYENGNNQLEAFKNHTDEIVFETGLGLPGIGLENDSVIWISDISDDKRFKRTKEALKAGLHSVVSIPVNIGGEENITILLFSNYRQSGDEDTISFLKAISNNIGIQLARKITLEQLEKTEKSLKYALSSANMAAWDVDLESGQILLSENYPEVINIEFGPVTNLDFLFPQIIEKDREDFQSHILDAIRNKGEIDMEIRVSNDSDQLRWLWVHGHFSESDGTTGRISGIVRDITEKKETEYELKRERELLELLYENIPVMITVYRPDLSNFRVNNEFEKITGWKNEDLSGINIIEEVFPDKDLRHKIVEFMQDPDSGWMDMPIRIKSGDILQSTWTNVRLSDDTQIGIGLNITGRKEIEEQLKEQKLYLSESQRIANLGTYRLNLDTGDAEATDILKVIYGFKSEHDLHITDWENTLHPDYKDEMKAYFDEVLREKKRFEKEYKIIRSGDGEERWLYENAEIELDESGTPRFLIGTVQDITRRKKYELEIRKSEAIARESRELLRKIFESLEEAVIILDPVTRTIIDCNEGAERIFGYKRDEMLGRDTEFLHVSKEKFEEFHNLSIDVLSKSGLFTTEFELKKKSGKTFISDHTVTVVKDDSGVIDRIVSVVRDITEHRTHEENIRKHRDRLLEAEEVARMGHWEYNLDTKKLYWSDMVYTVFGLEKVNFTPSVDEFITYIHPEDREKIKTSEERLMKYGRLEHIYRFVKPDGELVYIQERGQYIENEEGRFLTGTVIDITNLKKAEEKLETERQRFELAVGAVSDVVWDYDAITGALWWGEGIETVFGYKREEISDDISFWEKRIFEEDREETIKSMRQAEKSNTMEWLAFYRFLDAEGNIREVEDSARIIRDEEGNLIRMIGAMLDVTELKMYRRELLQERTRFEIIAQSTNDIIYDHDLENNELWANDEITTIMGYNHEKHSYPLEWWEEHIHPDDKEQVIKSHQNFLKTGGDRWQSEYRFIGNNQQVIHIKENSFAIRGDDGTAIRLLGAMIDVTAEKESERILRESEEQYRRLFEQNPYPMLIFDPASDKIVQVNRATVNTYGYSVDEFKKMTVYEFHPPDDRENLMQKFSEGRNGLKYYGEITHQTKSGDKLVVNITALDIQYRGDKRRLVVINDITEQKKAEERIIGSVIEGSENERRRIAKELHDGLGQYLTAASLNLDSVYEELKTLPEKKMKQYEKGLKLLRNAIVESRRISQNLLPKAIEDFGLSLAVQSLIDDVAGSSEITIAYSDNLNGIDLGENVELNIYRIIQEGMNNAVRHADCNRVDIQLILDENQLICTIEDNGTGFQLDSDEVLGLGITNIRNRVNALSGEVEFSSRAGKGTLITVIVPVNVV